MNCCCCRPKTAGLRNTALHLCYCYYYCFYCTSVHTYNCRVQKLFHIQYSPYAVQYVLGTTYRTKCVNIIRSSLLTYAIHISGSKSNTVENKALSSLKFEPFATIFLSLGGRGELELFLYICLCLFYFTIQTSRTNLNSMILLKIKNKK